MTENTQVTIPIVNNNGTTREGLLGPIYTAYKAVQDAYAAICLTAPHGRDYQISPPDDYRKARAEFEQRVNDLLRIQSELQTLYIGIEKQCKLRRS